MYKSKKNIFILAGILIVIVIFAIIVITSVSQRIDNLNNLINSQTTASDKLDKVFITECIDPTKISGTDVKVSDDGHVVGFEIGCTKKTGFEFIKNNFEKNGWIYIESGSDSQGTFSKQEGTYTWAFVNVVEVGSNTCVVITVD